MVKKNISPHYRGAGGVSGVLDLIHIFFKVSLIGLTKIQLQNLKFGMVVNWPK